MIFEYDENKSLINKSKHGDEDRLLVLGQINSKNYTEIITYREANIRIISIRRSREKEIKLYESIRAR